MARIAHLTGRNIVQVDERQRSRFELKAGDAVKQLYVRDGEERFHSLLSVLLPPCDKIVLDPIVQGFSGLYVAKAHCIGPSRSTWLIKWGLEVRKLQEEAAAHRRMFEDGFTREYSLPQLWPNVVTWEGLGGIAYEFAEGAGSLFDLLSSKKPAEIGDLLTPMLSRLYRNVTTERELPQPYLERLMPKILRGSKEENYGPRVAAVCSGTTPAGLGQSLNLLKGVQHGDMHSRNILVLRDRPVLIDFVHYRNGQKDGLPLLDIAKLLVDFCAFAPPGWIDASQVLSGAVFQGDFKPLLGVALGKRAEFQEAEAHFWSAAVACLLAEYTTYADLPSDRRDQFIAALRSEK